MNDKIRSRLDDCLTAAMLIQEWVPQHTEEQVGDDPILWSAYLLQFERIGETLRVVRDKDPEFERLLPDIHEWVSLRHHLLHDYREIDLELLWQYATQDIPGLVDRIEEILHTR